MKRVFRFFSIFVLSFVMVVASVVPAGATSTGLVVYQPNSDSGLRYSDVFFGQVRNQVCAYSLRVDSSTHDYNTGEVIKSQYSNDMVLTQVSDDSSNNIYKKAIVRFRASSDTYNVYLLVFQTTPFGPRQIGQNLYQRVYHKTCSYDDNWRDVLIPNSSSPITQRSPITFDIFGFHCGLIFLTSYNPSRAATFSVISNGKTSDKNDSEVLSALASDEIVSGVGEGAWDILDPDEIYDPSSDPDNPAFFWTDADGSTYYGKDNPNYQWTDADGSTYYGKDNPNYQWTDADGSTYPEVSSNFGDDFGAIRGYISEIGSFSDVMSENYESQSELCSQARLQIDSLISSIPVPIFIALGLVALVIVALKILQR